MTVIFSIPNPIHTHVVLTYLWKELISGVSSLEQNGSLRFVQIFIWTFPLQKDAVLNVTHEKLKGNKFELSFFCFAVLTIVDIGTPSYN